MSKYIYGKNSVMDALNNHFPIKKLFIQNNLSFKQKLNFKNISYITLQEMNKLVKGNHQGFIAEIEEYRYFDIGTIIKDKASQVLVLDHIQDPQNFGAILRSANAFNFNYIIIPKDRACDVTPTVLKTSSGGFNGLKIIKVSSLLEAINFLKEKGFWVYASALNNNAKKLDDLNNFALPICLIVGNEEKGISSTLLKNSDEVIYIEQFGTVQSLNVSVASAILMHKIKTTINKK